MTRLTLFTIPLIFSFGGTAAARHIPRPAQNSASPAVAAPPQKTPLRAAEMHAQILMAQKDYAAAIDAYGQIIRQDPKNAKALNQMGIAYQELGEFDMAERSYKRAMRAGKTFASPVSNLGTIEYEKKNYRKAIRYYKKAILVSNAAPKFDPNLGTLYLNLGSAYVASEQYPLATESFAKALALDPHVLESGGEGGSLLDERSPNDPGLFFFLLAKTYAKKGDAERTAHYLKIARDDGYEKFRSATTDPDFSAVINDPRVQEVLTVAPSYAPEPRKSSSL